MKKLGFRVEHAFTTLLVLGAMFLGDSAVIAMHEPEEEKVSPTLDDQTIPLSKDINPKIRWDVRKLQKRACLTSDDTDVPLSWHRNTGTHWNLQKSQKASKRQSCIGQRDPLENHARGGDTVSSGTSFAPNTSQERLQTVGSTGRGKECIGRRSITPYSNESIIPVSASELVGLLEYHESISMLCLLPQEDSPTNSTTIQFIVTQFPNLTYLDLRNTGIPSEGLVYLNELKELKTLFLPNGKELGGEEIREYFQQLLIEFLSEQEVGLEEIDKKTIEVDASKLEILLLCADKVINLNLISWCISPEEITNLSLEPQPGSSVKNRHAQFIAEHFPNLAQLEIKYCIDIRDSGIIEIAERCPKLTDLNLCGCSKVTDKGVEEVVKYCSNLVHLNLCDCNQITDEGIKKIAECCSDLVRLDLSYCENITDEGIEAIVQGCKDLEDLSLESCDKITDNSLEYLCTLKKLKGLNLYKCKGITDRGTPFFSTTLERLDISYTSITNIDFLRNFQKLVPDGLHIKGVLRYEL